MSVNKVILIGRLGQDPEMRYTSGGKNVATVNLATSTRYQQSGQWQEKTEWHRVVFWERLAEVVNQYCKKGSQIFVEGQLQTRKWQDNNGQTQFTTEVVGKGVQFLDPKGSNSPASNAGSPGSGQGFGNPAQQPQQDRFQQSPQGGFGNQPPQQGGFQQPPQQRDFNQPQQQGGFGNQMQQSGFQQPPRQKGFNPPPPQNQQQWQPQKDPNGDVLEDDIPF